MVAHDPERVLPVLPAAEAVRGVGEPVEVQRAGDQDAQRDHQDCHDRVGEPLEQQPGGARLERADEEPDRGEEERRSADALAVERGRQRDRDARQEGDGDEGTAQERWQSVLLETRGWQVEAGDPAERAPVKPVAERAGQPVVGGFTRGGARRHREGWEGPACPEVAEERRAHLVVLEEPVDERPDDGAVSAHRAVSGAAAAPFRSWSAKAGGPPSVRSTVPMWIS